MARNKFTFISLNMIKDKHDDLIKWIKEESFEREMSMSAFCISILKKEYKRLIDEKNRLE